MKKRKSLGVPDGSFGKNKKKRTSLPPASDIHNEPANDKISSQSPVQTAQASPKTISKDSKKKRRNRVNSALRSQERQQSRIGRKGPSAENESDSSDEDEGKVPELVGRTEPKKSAGETNGRTGVDGSGDSLDRDSDDHDVIKSNRVNKKINVKGGASRTTHQRENDDERSESEGSQAESENGEHESKFVQSRDSGKPEQKSDKHIEPESDGSVENDDSEVDDDDGGESKEVASGTGKEEDGKKTDGGNEGGNQDDEPPGDQEKEAGAKEISLDDAQKFTNAILTKTTFNSLKESVCEGTLRGISDMGFTFMTEIQEKTLPPLLEGRDLLAAAKTGSGKTLAFLIPAIELIHKLKFMPRNGTGIMIISPTRELCMQIYGVLKEVMVHHYHTYGIVMGGTNRTTEMKKLEKGVNILVATPGRLLDHMQKTPQFLFKNLQCLVIDEADRILDIGFEEDMRQIVKLLPKKRQTMLFSATQTRKTEDLARVSLKKQPIYIGVDDEKTVATVNGLEQGYVLCPSEKRFLLLFTFLKKNRSKKVMVFMSSCKSVKYHAELLNYIDLPVACIHGRKKQANRTTTFFQFCQAKQGILICTDVAARGLDIPAVDWIVQYDPPDDPKEYIHRVGRTARGLHGQGHALLILRPEEAGFLRYLKHAKVPINEYDFSWAKVANIQIQLEKLVEKNYFLHVSAKEAYKSYIRAYQSHSLKKIYRLESLDLNLVAKSFGFRVPPSVDLIVPTRKRSEGRDKRFDPRQRNFKKAQKSKIFRHVENKRDRKDMRSVMTH